MQEEEKLRSTGTSKQMFSVERAGRRFCPCLAEHIGSEAEDELGASWNVYFPVRKEPVHLLISSLMLAGGSAPRIGWKSCSKQGYPKPASHAPQSGSWMVLPSPVLSAGWLWGSSEWRSFTTFPNCNTRAKVPTGRPRSLPNCGRQTPRAHQSHSAQGSLLAVLW